jgi:hypothetical protein
MYCDHIQGIHKRKVRFQKLIYLRTYKPKKKKHKERGSYSEGNRFESQQRIGYFWLSFLIGIVGDGVQLGPFGTATTNRPIVPAPGDYDNGEISGMMIGRGNRSIRRKPAPVLLCPTQTPHAARTRTRAVAVGSQRITAWATARSSLTEFLFLVVFRSYFSC